MTDTKFKIIPICNIQQNSRLSQCATFDKIQGYPNVPHLAKFKKLPNVHCYGNTLIWDRVGSVTFWNVLPDFRTFSVSKASCAVWLYNYNIDTLILRKSYLKNVNFLFSPENLHNDFPWPQESEFATFKLTQPLQRVLGSRFKWWEIQMFSNFSQNLAIWVSNRHFVIF